MADELNDKVVAMHAIFKTDGNDKTRQRTISQVMDANKILSAPTLKNAIEYFTSQV